MLYGMYVSAAGAMANMYRQDIVANNLANAETVGFKRDLALLQSRSTEAAQNGRQPDSSRLLEGMGGGLFSLPTYTDFTPASLTKTGSDYDLALAGKGFFRVSNGKDIYYTRDGRLTTNSRHELVTVAGKLPVLDTTGKPLAINPGGGKLKVAQNGQVSQDGTVIGRIGVYDFADTRVLRKQGQNLYQAPPGARSQPVSPIIKQGALENSGINQISELTQMIRTNRLIQDNIMLLQIQDQTLNLAVSRLGNISA